MKRTCYIFLRAGLVGSFLLFLSMLAAAQNRVVTGKVTDAKANLPLQGVTVQGKGSTVAAQTGADGGFSISVPQNVQALIFSFVGYADQEVAISGNTLNVGLQPGGQSLQDVVVIGYGTRRKSDLTGAVGSVRAQQLEERPSASLNQALAGRIAGVQVNTNSGRPGGQTNVRIRGFSSINATNNPLYVVDGVILPVGTQTNNSNAIDYINPNDIASVEVLKDASATAIYGARGANGVILITTKKGSTSGGRITYDVDVSIPTLGPKRVEMLNAREYLDVENLAYDNIKVYDPAGWAAGNYASVVDPRAKRKNLPLLFDANGNPLYETDWLEESTRSKLSQNHQLGITGGNADGTYGIFLGLRDDNGLLLNSYLQRYSARAFFDSKIKEWVRIGASLGYYNQEENIVDGGTGGLNATRMITEAFPFLPVRYADGSYAENWQYPGAEGGSNPVHILNERKNIINTQTTLGNVYVNISILKGLEFRSVLGTSIVTRGNNFYSSRSLDQLSRSQSGVANVNNGRESYWSSENYFTYNTKLGDDHDINALLGFGWNETNIFNMSASSQNFSTDFFEFNNIGAASQQNPGGSGRARFSFNSYFGRVNYTFRNKYLVTITGRVDGSSKFGEEQKYSLFPSAALAWRISEEDFLKTSNLISNLKLRASYGQTGNSEIATYQSLGLLGTGYAAIFNNQRVAGVGTNRLANPDLKWEKTAQSDIGLELGLFNNRVNLEVDAYYRKTTDMLLAAPVPTTSGFSSITRNIGSMENKGLEFSLYTINVNSKDFTWSTNLNWSMNRNKVLSLATPAPIFGGNPGFVNNTGIIQVGQPVASFWGLIRLGVWTAAEAAEAAKYSSYRGGKPILPGDLKYKDLNGDYIINDADRTIIGNGSPKGWGSFINNFKYKNFEVVLDIQYSYGNDVLNHMKHSGEDRVSIANSFKTVLDAYDPVKGNTNTEIAAIRDTRAGYVTNVDTRWLEDGSFIRGRNFLVSYTFPSVVAQNIKLSRLRVYAAVQNFFLKSNFSGNDPEVTTYGNAFSQGQTFFDYPKPTTYLLGLNIAL